ncbi:MAG: Asp-tRNA(Asn)/Glu-tRNA(Gln) amidotransferase subunit GatB [Clostridia bacterium]|nr:Asp-tRNA(Asn)/Glu-tRNA(Gln) amidotransferase subunit GatB [Clostridia bacterium]
MYQAVIGVEVHFELSTETKLFCRCRNSFGEAENTLCCPVCLGLPGALPVINSRAVEYAISVGLALGCRVNSSTRFDRKSYFYPDMPNEYQTTQAFIPICVDGCVEYELDGEVKSVGIHEIHLEDDAGKLIHSDNGTRINYNRAGVPLIEIVTEPELHTAEETVAFLEELRLRMSYLGISDCKMQEGSMRVDVNLSVHKPDQPLGTRTEIKNLNSFRAVANAIKNETQRQIKVIENGGTVIQETRRFDDVKGVSTVMRSKETHEDYRFFPEPNLPPMYITDAQIDHIRTNLPEFASKRQKRLCTYYGISSADAKIITADRLVADYFEAVASLCDQREAANRIVRDLMQKQRETKIHITESHLTAEKLAEIINLFVSDRISRRTSREVADVAFCEPIDVSDYIEKNGLFQITDEQVISDAARSVISENAAVVNDYRNGKSAAFSYLVGETIKRLNGRASPQIVNKMVDLMLKSNKNL